MTAARRRAHGRDGLHHLLFGNARRLATHLNASRRGSATEVLKWRACAETATRSCDRPVSFLHPRGVQFRSVSVAAQPDQRGMETPENWIPCWENKNVRIVHGSRTTSKPKASGVRAVQRFNQNKFYGKLLLAVLNASQRRTNSAQLYQRAARWLPGVTAANFRAASSTCRGARVRSRACHSRHEMETNRIRPQTPSDAMTGLYPFIGETAVIATHVPGVIA